MFAPIKQVKEWREKADAFRAEKKWAEAAEAYGELVKAWLCAAGVALSPEGKADRVEASRKAELLMKECLAKAPPKQVNQTGNRTSQPSSENKFKGDSNDTDSKEEDLGPNEPMEELLKQLDALVGLEGVKKQVRKMIDFLVVRQWREAEDLPNADMTHHLVFTGNAGTGKTTVARLIAKIYRTLGILTKGQLVETDQTGLVAGYLGQTAIKTKAKIEEALGGVLFIDEAYALIPNGPNGFAEQAINTLVPEMDNHRRDLVVIVAGYPDLMHKFIYETNPGLPARFPIRIHFDDYSADELVEIFRRMASSDRYQFELAEGCLEVVRKYFEDVIRAKPDKFGNARMVRNLLEGAIRSQAQRLATAYKCQRPNKETLKTLTVEDLAEPIAEQQQQSSPTE